MVYYLFPRIWQSLTWAGHKIYSAFSTAGHNIEKTFSTAGKDIEKAVSTPFKGLWNWEMYMRKKEITGLTTAEKDIEKAGNWVKSGFNEYTNLWKNGANTIKNNVEGVAKDVNTTEKKITNSIFSIVKRWHL
jgi:predicted small secreted protein